MLESFHSSDVVLKVTPDEFRQDQNMQSLFFFFPFLVGGWDMRTGNRFLFSFLLFLKETCSLAKACVLVKLTVKMTN